MKRFFGYLFWGYLFIVLSSEVGAKGKDAFVKQAEAYLNQLQSWTAHFDQRQPDGSSVSGQLWVSRPGLMRLDYDPPSRSKLYVHDDWVVQRDDRLDETTHIPLNRTPAGFFLSKTIRLDERVKIAGVRQEKDLAYLKLVRAEDEAVGSIILVFGKNPLVLKAWYIVDEARNLTEVVLRDLKTSHNKDRSWFVYKAPMKDITQGR